VIFDRVNALPLRVVLYLFDHLRIAVLITKITCGSCSTCSSDLYRRRPLLGVAAYLFILGDVKRIELSQ
jgi:hypothetical protein